MERNFYFLNWAQKKGEVVFEAIESYDEKKIKTGAFVPITPFLMKVTKGTKFFDVARFADPFNFAISEKVYNLLKEHNITGWDGYQLKLNDFDLEYYGFVVTGKCGELKKPVRPGSITGLEFDLKTWDGSDIFCPRGALHVFFTEKVKSLITENGITNFGQRI